MDLGISCLFLLFSTQPLEILRLLYFSTFVLIICKLPHVFQKVVAFLSNISSIKALSLKHIYPQKKILNKK